MAISVQFLNVATAIASLSVTGVTIQDVDKVPSRALTSVPIFYPKPDGFITNLAPVDVTFGINGLETMDFQYDLTYRYLHAAIGTNLNFGVYQQLITNIVALLAAILNKDTFAGAPGVDVRLRTVLNIGPVEDPEGNRYHGCDFVFAVKEYSQQ